MRFIADLHIHSHFSISTSPQLTPEHLEAWARIKGISVIGTGDFTHPGWLEELKEKLEAAEEGLFCLKRDYRLHGDDTGLALPDNFVEGAVTAQGQPNPVRFVLSAEISNIYRRAEKVRKVHNLILVPTFQAAEFIQKRLSRFANISSDGRPILGLDSRDLLEITLEASDRSFFVPAHIWTPWFSALGAKSGFDSMAECYGDLSTHIKAVETGLSSDPPMNWLCSFLDGYTLISNSDAHSPEKLGREANLLDTDMSYPGIISGLSSGQTPEKRASFLGTIEFFPQEGKYHYDGHRKCGVCWDPMETLRHRGLCSVCGKPVTIGVLNRVAQLADRERIPDPHSRRSFHSLIPLKEIFSEITGIGAQSKQIARLYDRAVRAAGSEFALLLDMPEDQIEARTNELLAEAIRRMRRAQVRMEPGFDGQFGRVRLFAEGEARELEPQELLFPDRSENRSYPSDRIPLIGFDITAYRRSAPATNRIPEEPVPSTPSSMESKTSEEALLSTLNAQQREAVTSGTGPLLILAGPGTGKTRTLTARIAFLVRIRGIEPDSILAVTFTNKAAEEMRNRLERQLAAAQVGALHLFTFHGLGLSFLKAEAKRVGRNERFSLIDDDGVLAAIRSLPGIDTQRATAVRVAISGLKSALNEPQDIADPQLRKTFELYELYLREQNLFDLDDLIHKPVLMFLSDPELLAGYRRRFRWIHVDEYQDINLAQYRMIRLLGGEENSNLFAIGDPNQAIYGFRGADVGFINRFLDDYPQATLHDLSQSYRCSDTILRASRQVLADSGSSPGLRGLEAGIRLQILENPSDKSEAEMIARTIEAMMGGLRFFSMDSSISEGSSTEGIQSLSDFAVLCRIGRQMGVLQEALQNHSIPYQTLGETPFYRQEPVKSIVDILRVAATENPLLRRAVLAKKIVNEQTLAKLRELAGAAVSVTDMISAVLSQSTVQVPQPQLRTLSELSDSFGTDLDKFLEQVLLGTAADSYNRSSEQVTLMTLHAAKGLEFACVFIAGCEQGLLPYSLFSSSAADPAEERRLFYVGMTRAKRYLFLSYAARRRLFGREYRMPRSPFLDPIEEGLLELKRSQARTAGPSATGKKQLDLF
ncbi:MAG: UvrD-helicase domain-containing protein [Spirochaetaceae bacterium]|nr:MAG: UvrD-helicase domain-containing protein [Spirochaetaceae bacterium]